MATNLLTTYLGSIIAMVILISMEIVTLSIYIPYLSKRLSFDKYSTDTITMERGSTSTTYNYKGYVYVNSKAVISQQKYFPNGATFLTITLNSMLETNCSVKISLFEKNLDEVSVYQKSPVIVRFTVDFMGFANSVTILPICLGDDRLGSNRLVNWESVTVQEAVRKVSKEVISKYDGDIRIAAFEIGWFGMNGLWDSNMPSNRTFFEEIKNIMSSARYTKIIQQVGCSNLYYENITHGAVFKTFDEKLDCFKGKDSPFYGQINNTFIGYETTAIPVKTPEMTASEYEALEKEYFNSIKELKLSYIYTNTQVDSRSGIRLKATKFMGPNLFIKTIQYRYDTNTQDLTINVVVGNDGVVSIQQHLDVYFGFGKVYYPQTPATSTISLLRYNICDECNVTSIPPGQEVSWTFVLKEIPKSDYDEENNVPFVGALGYSPISKKNPTHFMDFDNKRMNKNGWLPLPSWEIPTKTSF